MENSSPEQKTGPYIALEGIRPSNNTNFFSYLRDDESKRTPIKARNVPWLGLSALIGSAFTSILSLIVLVVIHNRPIWPNTGWYKFMQPASWLSALISLNSILLHVALTEGVTVAWWFTATRQTATVADLHHVWSTGTSAASVVKHWRNFSYISLATLFVAIIPINGFLLQDAILTPLSVVPSNVTLSVPMMQQLPKGYSGYMATNGGVGSFNSVWPRVFQQVQNVAGSRYARYAYFGNYDYNGVVLSNEFVAQNDTNSTYTAYIPGAGFNMTCVDYEIPYDLLPTESNPIVKAKIFQSGVYFNLSTPNTARLHTFWKVNSSCVGTYIARNCTLKAATVRYPVQMKVNVSPNYAGPYYSLLSGTSYRDDVVEEELPIYPEENIGNTTYGGIFNLFNEAFGSSASMTSFFNGTGILGPDDQFALGLNVGFDTAYPEYTCNATFDYSLMNIGFFQALNRPGQDGEVLDGIWNYMKTVDIADVILEQVRQSMFLSAVYAGTQWFSINYIPFDWDSEDYWLPGDQSTYIQNVTALRQLSTPIYKVRWYMWGASVALTNLIILVILPTFWGFWILHRKPTMSPVDMARAFNAPVLTEDESKKLKLNALLKEVGNKNIHHELR